jgi:hypothetical protein
MFGEYQYTSCSQHIPIQDELHPFNKGESVRLRRFLFLKEVWNVRAKKKYFEEIEYLKKSFLKRLFFC